MLMVVLFRMAPGITEVLRDNCLVKFVSLTLDDAYGVLRTIAEAGAQSVTEVVGGKDRLSVYYFDGPFRACGDAESATVAFFRIYGYDFSFHYRLLFPDLPAGLLIIVSCRVLWGQNNLKMESHT
jgi:hypothetical protein